MEEPRLDTKLNKHDKIYHQLSYDILTSPKLNFREADRTVIHTIGGFGPQVHYDLSDGTIPLSQTKPIGYKTQLIPEIAGFIRNETNLKWYLEQGMKIWTANAFNFYRNKLSEDHSWKNLKKDTPAFEEALHDYEELVLSGKNSEAGDLGRFYPEQWRNWVGLLNEQGQEKTVYVDQLQDMVDNLQSNPTSRYHIVTAWNPVDVKFKQAALAPCHNMFQAYRYTDTEGVQRLDVKMYQRSCDHLLGKAFNAPQYAALTAKIASLIGVEPGEFIHSFGDIHLYVGGDKRAEWYTKRENLKWLQDRVKTEHPHTVLEDLLKQLPDEQGTPGYDHIPYLLKQMGLKSKGPSPQMSVASKPLDKTEVDDFKITGYKLKDRPEKVLINDHPARMAS